MVGWWLGCSLPLRLKFHLYLSSPNKCVCTLLFTRRKLTTVQITDGVPVNMSEKFINNLRQAVLRVNSLQLHSVHIAAGACSTFGILHATKLLPWWEGEADHLPVPAEFQFELLNKLSKFRGST